tara:strand:- start:211 stop:480 length:270 start_codon:yes stop_codon:yes gene_type:complete
MENTITINDSQLQVNDKLAKAERQAIINDFESDFGFSLKDLPSLDLPLNEYCNQLPQDHEMIEALCWIELSKENPHWDCETDAYDRFKD